MFERFSRAAKVSVVLAQEEARELAANDIRPEHLLVGVLQSAGRDLAALLAGFGLTVEEVRGKLVAADAPVTNRSMPTRRPYVPSASTCMRCATT